ncbi:MAG TPA: SRPBCC family protein [Solirubrobacterales bacterium]|jgi:uncharacterized protein YndB with AHSA1/START domain
MPSPNGVLEEVDGRPALRFERLLPHPPDRVWRALTDPERQSAWHPTPARFEPRRGGRAHFVKGGDVPGMPDGVVTDYEPPRLLGYTWGEEGPEADHLRWELRPHDDGCLLILVHTFDDPLKAARDGAGWHVCLDALDADLDGREPVATDSDTASPWEELNCQYQEQFGISPEEATPPPSRESPWIDRSR